MKKEGAYQAIVSFYEVAMQLVFATSAVSSPNPTVF